MDKKKDDTQPIAGKKSKLTIVFVVTAIVVVAALAVFYFKQAPVGKIKPAPEASSASAVTAAPSPSQSTPPAAQKTGTAALSWNANTEADFAGYKIYYGTAPRTGNCPPGGYPDKIDVKKTDTPKKPSYKLTGLENGRTYYFSITTYDTSGNESCFSSESRKSILAN
jgi:hypothetical protein